MSATYSFSGSREEKYGTLLQYAEGLLHDETDTIANTANITALLNEAFNWHWTGFYFVKGNELVLGPFQGPVACTRIQAGKGVCGAAWTQAETMIVQDVHQFPGHIACSPYSNSEIVVPVIKNGYVHMVLDIDSTEFSDFDETDRIYLEKLCQLLAATLPDA